MDVKHSVEATGDDVEAAIAAGLEQLGVTSNDVLVEVLEEPSRGVFGIGAKQARVRLKLLRLPEPPAPRVAKPREEFVDYDYDDDEPMITDTVASDDGEVGKSVLLELLGKMGITGQVTVYKADPTYPNENTPWVLDIQGPDVNLLIGRRGETLSSLQYITRLITSRHLQRRANVIVDAGEYKTKRSHRLRQLALRMADQAVQSRRVVALEPMPPNERRIIHLTLRNRTDVDTESEGEGNNRKVTIIPKYS